MDLESADIILANISKENRNRIRRSENSGVMIHHGKDLDLLNDFYENL